ncbi:SAM-dependent methyltransferase, partial [Staphylococcus condimenti]
MAEAGHTFLAKLGKTRLRPGGKEATDWLIDKGHFKKDKKVLEVACNM